MLAQNNDGLITIDSAALSNLPSTYITTGATFNYGGYSHNTSNSTLSPVEYSTDIVVKGKSLLKTLDDIQSRLAILDDPSPEKLEKYAALKKAYEHYKLLEKLLKE